MTSTSPPSGRVEFQPQSYRVESRTVICVLVVNLMYLAQLSSVTGTGFLAQSMAEAVGGIDKTVWYSSCITIMTVALNPPLSQVADYWCRKPILIASTIAGVVGSIVVARAQSAGMIIAGFAVLGLGFGPIGQASSSIAASAGGVFGLLLGGGLLRHGNLSNYRIFWYVEAGIYALAALGCYVGYNPPPRELQSSLRTSEKIKCLDWVGYLLFPPALALFSVALAWSNNPYTWRTVNILAPFIISVVAMALFGIYEHRFTTDGMIHHGLWRDRNFPVSLLVITVEGLSFFATNSYFAYEITVIYNTSVLSAATNFAIVFFTGLVASPVLGIWSSKRKSLRWPLVVGGIVLLLFFILLAIVQVDTPRYVFWILPILPGIALASIVPLTMVSAQFAVSSPELVALASALMTTARSLGGAIGLAINNAVVTSALNKQLPERISAAVLPLGLPSSSLAALITILSSSPSQDAATELEEVPGVTPEIAQAAVIEMKRTYLAAFRNAWIVSAAFCAIMVISCYFIVDRRSNFDNRVDAPVHTGLARSPGDEDWCMSPVHENPVRHRGANGTSVQHEENV